MSTHTYLHNSERQQKYANFAEVVVCKFQCSRRLWQKSNVVAGNAKRERSSIYLNQLI